MENWGAVAARGLLGKRGLPELDLRALTAMCGEFTGGKDVLHAALIESEPRLSGSDSPRSLGPVLLSPLIRRVATGRSDRSSILPTASWPSWQCIACYSWRPRKAHVDRAIRKRLRQSLTSDTLTLVHRGSRAMRLLQLCALLCIGQSDAKPRGLGPAGRDYILSVLPQAEQIGSLSESTIEVPAATDGSTLAQQVRALDAQAARRIQERDARQAARKARETQRAVARTFNALSEEPVLAPSRTRTRTRGWEEPRRQKRFVYYVEKRSW